MTALIGDVIIPLSHGFDLGPFILGCALASIFAFMLAALNNSSRRKTAASTGTAASAASTAWRVRSPRL
jgi:hypothetical protein